MGNNNELGRKGEGIAVDFLRNSGYDILETNYRYRRGEIDLIARKEKLLIFVEVKLRSRTDYGYPEMAVDDKKAGLIMETAENYLQNNDWKHDIRFDIISVVTKENKVVEVEHFEDAIH